jgi:hypothetical protein
MKKTCRLICCLALLVSVGIGLFRWAAFVPEAAFQVQTPFFSGQRVMVLVPHQDDEINLAGGILEQ